MPSPHHGGLWLGLGLAKVLMQTALTSLLNRDVSHASESGIILHTALVSAEIISYARGHIQYVRRFSAGSGSSDISGWQKCPGVHVATTGAASHYGTCESDCTSNLYPSTVYCDLHLRGH